MKMSLQAVLSNSKFPLLQRPLALDRRRSRHRMSGTCIRKTCSTFSSIKCLTFTGKMSTPEIDVYEKVKSFEFSLTAICAVKVVHGIIESVGMKNKDYQDFNFNLTKYLEHLNAEASKRFEKMNLPARLKEMLVRFVDSVYYELYVWHNKYMFDVRPMWTPHGTIDLVRSSRAVVDDPNLSAHYRFLVASAFCHERQIYELARQLSRRELAELGRKCLSVSEWSRVLSLYNPNSTYSDDPFYCGDRSPDVQMSPLTEFWIRVIEDGRVREPQETWEEGLSIALEARNEAAILHFLVKVDPEGILRVLYELAIPSQLHHWHELSPATQCLLFSTISDMELRRSNFDNFVHNLLWRLASWPYQQFFLDVARFLCVHASDSVFTDFLLCIVYKPGDGFKDFDYRGLFVGFCEMISSLNPEWSMGKHLSYEFILAALRTEDERWMKFIFGKLSDIEKEDLLLYNDCIICFDLIIYEEFHLLEQFIRLCGVTRIDLLLKINETLRFTSEMSRGNSEGETVDTIGRRLISQAVHKIIVEQQTVVDDAMPSAEEPEIKKRRLT